MFDPFGDFESRGYLRNHHGEKDLELVKIAEHEMFRAKVGDAIAFLAGCGYIDYSHFLKVHEILFAGIYPWAGQDRGVTAPNLSVTKGEVVFSHPQSARLAVTQGLQIGQDPSQFRNRLGEVMGLFAYGHPFLDCNGRTMLVVHWELCFRSKFAIDWPATGKDRYLDALTKEIARPNSGILDAYLKPFVIAPQSREAWAAFAPSMKGLDGRGEVDVELGDFSDPAVAARYSAFERNRDYKLGPQVG